MIPVIDLDSTTSPLRTCPFTDDASRLDRVSQDRTPPPAHLFSNPGTQSRIFLTRLPPETDER